MAKIIGITGGKGGTGKSMIAAALANDLSKDQDVLLVDADVDCPNDHLLLSIQRDLKEDVFQRIPVFDKDKCIMCSRCADVCKTNSIVSIKGKAPLFMEQQCNGCGSCKHVCPSDAISWGNKNIGQIYGAKKGNIALLSGELKINEPVSEFIVNKLNDMIDGKRSEYDIIIIDTAAGTHCPVIAALEMCDHVFCVTEPTPLGKHDLEAILMLIKMVGVSSEIVLNRSDIGDMKLIEKLALDYGIEIISRIPYLKEIADNYSRGIPISSREIKEIAGKINEDIVKR